MSMSTVDGDGANHMAGGGNLTETTDSSPVA